MKKTGTLLFAFLLLLAGCSEKATVDKPISENPLSSPEVDAKLVAAGNNFTWDLFRAVVNSETEHPNKNIFVSPLSASIALGMTYNGARDETQTAMQNTLGFADLTPLEIDKSYHDLIAHFSTLDPNVQFEIANSIWHDKLFTVEPEFIEVNQTYFDAVVSALDFTQPEAVTTINNWVSDKTHGKIAGIIEDIPDDIVMYLINALYFKGSWKHRFDAGKTKPGTFYCSDGSRQICNYMNMVTDSLNCLWTPSVTAVELPYSRGDYRMIVAKPTDPDSSVDCLIAGLNDDTWAAWRSGMRRMSDLLALPKFRFSYSVLLNDPLTTMGMSLAFSDQADFRGINRDRHLKIDEVLQKTFVQVDEEGTEAAAVTSVGIRGTSVGPSFAFDRPFLFLIYDHQTGAVMFIGKVARPSFN